MRAAPHSAPRGPASGENSRPAPSDRPGEEAEMRTSLVALALVTRAAFGASQDAAPSGDWPKEVRLAQADAFVEAPEARSLEGTKLTATGAVRVVRHGESAAAAGTV